MNYKNFGYKAPFVSYAVIQVAYLTFAGDLVPSVTSIQNLVEARTEFGCPDPPPIGVGLAPRDYVHRWY